MLAIYETDLSIQKELKQWWKNFSLLLFWYFIFMQLVSFLPIYKENILLLLLE